MTVIKRVLLLLLFAVNVSGVNFFEDELKHIDKYELVSIRIHDNKHNTNPSQLESVSPEIISFTAFNHLYNIELTPNKNMIPSNIRHTNENLSAGYDLEQYFTHLTEACHYFGKVLNSREPSNVALSICNKRGVRGSITAFNHTLIIKPAKYYLDIEYDRYHYHDITDPHLVYKHNHTQNAHHTQTRRRMSSETSRNMEMYILSDPIFTSYYVTKYPSNWYDQIISYFADEIHGVSAEYQNTDWGTYVGTISVSLVEVEIAHEYNHKYKSLTPHASDSSCADILRSDSDCKIDAEQYLDDFKEYLAHYKNLTTFDNAQLWSKMLFSGDDTYINGLAFSSTVCQGAGSSAVVSTRYVGDIGAITVSAHELGHAFGMFHDSDSGAEACTTSEGIMGGNRPNGFSSCSIASVQDYFDKYRRRMNCLTNTVRGFSSNYETDGTLPTSMPVVKTTKLLMEYLQCATIHNMDSNLFNGDWDLKSTNANQLRVYILNSYYLYPVTGVTNYWVISDVEGSDDFSINIRAYCISTRLIDCVSWVIKTEDGWFEDQNAEVSDCASNTTIIAEVITTPSPITAAHDHCIHAMNMYFSDFNGVWSFVELHADHDMYAFNSYYLYYSLTNNEWLISRINGSENIDDIIAYCRSPADVNVVQCSEWRIYDDVKYAYNLDADGLFASCDSWKCVGFEKMSNSIFDGSWNEFGSLEGRKTYTLNGLYLYYATERNDWLISRALGSRDTDRISAYCTHFDVSTCSHSWFISDDADFKQDNNSIVYDCSNNGNDSCTSYECLSIAYMTKDGDDSNFNGDWYPQGCINGEAYYTMESRDDWRYLCHHDEDRKWVITDALCTGNIYAYCPQNDVLDCGDVWFVDDGYNLVRDSNSLIWDCTAKSEVESPSSKGTNRNSSNREFECAGLDDYSSQLCIFSNDTLWSGWREFKASKWMCLHDKAVYHYDVKDVNVILEGELSYYLHWEKYYFQSSNGTDGEWIISMNKVSANAKASCSKMDLLGCTRGYWETPLVEGNALMMKGGEITIMEDDCGIKESEEEDVEDEHETKNSSMFNTFMIGAIIMGALLVIILVIVACVMRKRRIGTDFVRQTIKTIYTDFRSDNIALGMSHRTHINNFSPQIQKVLSGQIVYEDSLEALELDQEELDNDIELSDSNTK